jgi:hypothetical protein
MMYVAHRKISPLFVWEPGVSVLFAGCLHASQRFSFLWPVLDSANNLVSLNKMQGAKDNIWTVPDGNQAFELQRQTYNKLKSGCIFEPKCHRSKFDTFCKKLLNKLVLLQKVSAPQKNIIRIMQLPEQSQNIVAMRTLIDQINKINCDRTICLFSSCLAWLCCALPFQF